MVQSPWEANWFAASQEIPRISQNPKVHYRTHKRPPPVSIVGQPNPVHIYILLRTKLCRVKEWLCLLCVLSTTAQQDVIPRGRVAVWIFSGSCRKCFVVYTSAVFILSNVHGPAGGFKRVMWPSSTSWVVLWCHRFWGACYQWKMVEIFSLHLLECWWFQIPCMVVKVGLKDALDKPLTVDANKFLSDLVGREVELKLVSRRQYFFLTLSLLWFS